MRPIEAMRSLERAEQTAFLALFAGARMPLQLMLREDNGELHHYPMFGKSECQRVPFFEFWRDKLPALGLVTYEESEPFALPGALPGHFGKHVWIVPTDAGVKAREAYWAER